MLTNSVVMQFESFANIPIVLLPNLTGSYVAGCCSVESSLVYGWSSLFIIFRNRLIDRFTARGNAFSENRAAHILIKDRYGRLINWTGMGHISMRTNNFPEITFIFISVTEVSLLEANVSVKHPRYFMCSAFKYIHRCVDNPRMRSSWTENQDSACISYSGTSSHSAYSRTHSSQSALSRPVRHNESPKWRRELANGFVSYGFLECFHIYFQSVTNASTLHHWHIDFDNQLESMTQKHLVANSIAWIFSR